MPLALESPDKKFTIIITVPSIEENQVESEANTLLISIQSIKCKRALQRLLTKHSNNLKTALALKNEEKIKLYIAVLKSFINDHALLAPINSQKLKTEEKKFSL